MGVNVRSKGQRGEREAAAVLNGWSDEVTGYLGLPSLVLSRNLDQTRLGGYDLTGIDWLALEVKRQENLSLPAWWRQAVKQAKGDQVPMLMYRQSRQPWRFLVRLKTYHVGPTLVQHGTVDAFLDMPHAKVWFQTELFTRLQTTSESVIT